MGEVYLAWDPALDRKVAIKVLSPELAGDAQWVARFEREARCMAQLDHPNVAPVYAIGTRGTQPYLVMKYLEGMPLSRHLETAPLPPDPREVSSLFRQICAGLDHIHARGLVHRDIKPSNIFVGSDGHVTILDFGVVKDVRSDLTDSGARVGTPSYMAPEQFAAGEITPRTDIYALGLLLLQVLSGQRGSRASLPTAPDSLSRAREAPAAGRAPWITAAQWAVISKAMSVDPSNRYGSCSELFAALNRALMEPSPAPVPEEKAAPVRRRSWRWVAAAPLTIGIVAALAWTSRPPPPPVDDTPGAPAPASAPAPTPAPEPQPEPGAGAVIEPPRARARPAKKRQAPAVVAERATLRVLTFASGSATWASASVDARPELPTPVEIELSPGSHKLRVQRSGFKTVEQTIQLEPGEERVLRVELHR